MTLTKRITIKIQPMLAYLALFGLSTLVSVLHAAAQPVSIHLIPQPREISTSRQLPLPDGLVVEAEVADADNQFTVKDLAASFEARGIHVADSSTTPKHTKIRLLRLDASTASELLKNSKLTFDQEMKAEGYVVTPTDDGLVVIASSPEGLFYGAQTIKQLVLGSGKNAVLRTASIRDWPAMRYRGMDDDLSRGPVPTLEFQKKQIATYAAYKLNVYSPYFENTFRYKSNPLPAAPGGAMTHADLAELVRFAKQYHVIIVPEQEAFGHLHNVLTYEQYADLAETPHGSVLAPGNAAVLPLIKEWFTELAEETPGPFLHIGGDETADLGKGKTKDDVKKRGLGQVYIDFLKKIDETLEPLNKRVLFWGDIAVNEPKLVPQLPKNMIAIPWDYDKSDKGYEHEITPFTQAGMETWIAPGVSNWSRVYPDNNIALLNIQGFIRDGQHLHSTGALTTAWDDDGEGLYNQDWYGVLFGASASWQAGESSIPQYQQSYGEVFHGDITGKIDQAQKELMEAQALLEPLGDGGASDRLFWIDPWSPEGQAVGVKLRPIEHDLRMHAERALTLLSQAQEAQSLREPEALAAIELGARRIDMIGLKFQLSDEIVSTYARALKARSSATPDDVDSALYEIADTNGRCQDLRNAYSLTRDLYEQAWLKENRPFWLHNVLVRYDLATQLWAQRGEAFAASIYQWHRVHTLPEASALGMPPS